MIPELPSTFPVLPIAVQIPANLPPPLLLAGLRARLPLVYSAVQLPPCFKVRLGGLARALPMRGWAIVVYDGLLPRTLAIGLGEDDARGRVRRLNMRTAPTGLHSLN